MGVADNPNLPERWSTHENVAWKVDVAGRGWSSPVVWGERVFVTTVVSDGERVSLLGIGSGLNCLMLGVTA